MTLEEIQNKTYSHLLVSFLMDLEERDYGKTTLENYRRTLCKIDGFIGEKGIETYTPTVGRRYYEYYLETHDIKKSRQKSMETAIHRLNDYYEGTAFCPQHTKEQLLIPKAFEVQVNSFLSKCKEAGNKSNTIYAKQRFVTNFLMDCMSNGCNGINSLNPPIVCQACIMAKNKDSWAAVRDFLRFLAKTGATETDLSTFVPHHKHKLIIPVTYSEDEIHRFEGAIDQSSDIGIRDYAMMLLATRLGIRSGDIVRMTLENLDFEHDMICFSQQKTGEVLRLPMLPGIKTALMNYIANARPIVADKVVFIRHNAPYQGITTSVLRFTATKYFCKAGIDTTAKKHGPHVFRSSLASSMINGNIPYEAVRKVLGHSDPDAIKHYARLDIEKLRECAIEVPEPSGTFMAFLNGGALHDKV